ncbi:MULTISPECIES: DNA-3-methyladenine glycosylase I [unclassified Fusibacter]|uniref:DNA-3-methyladenine glycosylase I n=1 Tax=unclassified Fusibacter TaxID=2624464 RepID=UPI0010125C4B|nr:MULTISPECIES: DNA-3-methyladenine glycosylase I [unclassified Fusibacter]MCK8059188.1 DNA-3-methyladenine glycosylase I [Fusibacter sp. A2]NPE22597.1 DNA-3-methyladenine glycosylase I [Fusibacter sp. A1]RXV60715.1 DNA-3-methyladenine glycosylase I [Fusibacter sp. A1]
MTDKKLIRCDWAGTDPLYCEYHDKEWGVPLYDDQKLFEMLCLEGAQAGLSWITILRRREGYRSIFDGFDHKLCARYTDEQLDDKLQDPRIIRNRLKVYSVRNNAIAFEKVIDEFGTFSEYLWSFVGGSPILNTFVSIDEVPATTALSDALSKDLKRRGFKFMGSTICYAYMQAVGIVNDHLLGCIAR